MYKLLLGLIRKIKPLLIKICPQPILKKGKRKFTASIINKMSDMYIIPFNKNSYPTGINLIGAIYNQTGLGEGCRLLANTLNQSQLPLTIYNYAPISVSSDFDKTWEYKCNSELLYNINIIQIQPAEMPIAYSMLSKELWDKRYNIAFWSWELEEFPDEWLPCLNVIDEIWCPSEFICNAIRKKMCILVISMPYSLQDSNNTKSDRKKYNLPENMFLFFMIYDHNSTLERKNPRGTLLAFKEAFSNNENVGIVLKISHYSTEDENLISEILGDRKNIFIITDNLSRQELDVLMSSIDVYVSLHRAEGFGLTIAEAMLKQKPVIATNWSANIEYMNSESACMVGYKIIELKESIYPFKAGSKWADPNISEAASYMKMLYENKQYYNKISMNGKKYAEEKLNIQVSVDRVNKRINEILNS